MKLTVLGKEYEVEAGSSAGDLLKNAFAETFKTFLAVKVNGEKMTDLFAPIAQDAVITPVTFEDEDGKKVFRHSCSHLLAMAVLQLYPNAKLAIGPAIENGFYYDFDVEPAFKPDDLPEIEKAMDKLMRSSLRPRRFTLPRQEAIALMREKNEPYKVELIEDLPVDAELSFYQMGDFVDLCAGPSAKPQLYQGVQADAYRGRLLARRRAQKDAMPDLRHLLSQKGGAGRIPGAAGGSQETRPPQARPRAGLVRSARRRPRFSVLLPQGNDPAQHSGGLLAGNSPQGRV